MCCVFSRVGGCVAGAGEWGGGGGAGRGSDGLKGELQSSLSFIVVGQVSKAGLGKGAPAWRRQTQSKEVSAESSGHTTRRNVLK